jgi:hypothetical protein
MTHHEIRATYESDDGREKILVVLNCLDNTPSMILDTIDDLAEFSQVVKIEVYLDVRSQGNGYVLQHSEDISHVKRRWKPERRRYQPAPITTIKCEHGPVTVKLDKELYSCLVRSTWCTTRIMVG